MGGCSQEHSHLPVDPVRLLLGMQRPETTRQTEDLNHRPLSEPCTVLGHHCPLRLGRAKGSLGWERYNSSAEDWEPPAGTVTPSLSFGEGRYLHCPPASTSHVWQLCPNSVTLSWAVATAADGSRLSCVSSGHCLHTSFLPPTIVYQCTETYTHSLVRSAGPMRLAPAPLRLSLIRAEATTQSTTWVTWPGREAPAGQALWTPG